jgi:hypothetical protein
VAAVLPQAVALTEAAQTEAAAVAQAEVTALTEARQRSLR